MKSGNSMKVCMLVALLVIGTACLADTLSPQGTTIDNTGTGLGSIFNVLDLNPGGSTNFEQGATVAVPGNPTPGTASDYTLATQTPTYTTGGGDVHNGSIEHTWTLAQLAAGGIHGSSTLGVVFQVNNAGTQSNSANWMSIISLTIYVWNPTGTTLLYSASCGGSGQPSC